MEKKERIEYLVDYIDVYLDGESAESVSELTLHLKDFSEQTKHNYTEEELELELDEALAEFKNRYNA